MRIVTRQAIQRIVLLSVILWLPNRSEPADKNPFSDEPAPFERLKSLWVGPAFSGNGDEIVAAFNEDRDRLPRHEFNAGLLSFCNGDTARMYWCGAFLHAESYTGGRSPDRLFAIAIWQEAIAIKRKKGDPPDSELRSLHHLTAIQAKIVGLNETAVAHKIEAERLFAEHDVGGPAVSTSDTEIYDSILVGEQPTK